MLNNKLSGWWRARAPLLLISLLLPGAASAITPGTVAIFSDGSVEKLLERSAGQEVWEDARLRRLVRSVNPLLPDLSRENLLNGQDYSRGLKSGEPGVLLKGKKGDEVKFGIVNKSRMDSGSERLYTCQHLGKHTLTIMGRKEPVQRFSCERYRIITMTWHKKVYETRVINYSPRLKMVVDQTRITPKRTEQRTLVRLLAPGSYRYATVRSELEKLNKKEGKK